MNVRFERYYRIRVGDYRLGLALEGDTVILVRFLHRKEIYRYFPDIDRNHCFLDSVVQDVVSRAVAELKMVSLLSAFLCSTAPLRQIRSCYIQSPQRCRRAASRSPCKSRISATS